MSYMSYFIICFLASLAGSICGVGGGVIIKPVMDASGMLDAVTVSFLSGCTVLSMTAYTFLKEKCSGGSVVKKEIGIPLAFGAAAGGIFGKWLFHELTVFFSDKNRVGAVQAACLLIVSAGTLFYTIRKNHITTCEVKGRIPIFLLGLALGILSSFLGIGGGPMNLIVLFFFFSMDTKSAAQYSLYMILFSQLSSLLLSVLTGNVPDFSPVLLMLMVIGGITGGALGRYWNQKISEKAVDRLFCAVLVMIIITNIYNIYRFTG